MSDTLDAVDTDLFDKETLEKEKDVEKSEDPDMTMPSYGSDEWNDYVMDKIS